METETESEPVARYAMARINPQTKNIGNPVTEKCMSANAMAEIRTESDFRKCPSERIRKQRNKTSSATAGTSEADKNSKKICAGVSARKILNGVFTEVKIEV